MTVPLWQALLLGGGFAFLSALLGLLGSRMRDKETTKLAQKTLDHQIGKDADAIREKLDARADALHKDQIEFLEKRIKYLEGELETEHEKQKPETYTTTTPPNSEVMTSHIEL